MRRGFGFYLVLLVLACLLAAPACRDSSDDDSDDDDQPDDDDQEVIPTTLDVTLVPEESADGAWSIGLGEGEPHMVRNDLRTAASRDSAGRPRLSMAYFMAATDMHYTDEEAPTRLTFFDSRSIFFGAFEAAFRPQEDLSAHELNAIVRTANRIQQDYERDFDCALNLGDSTDNGQFNEIMAVIDVLDGTGYTSGIPGYARIDSGDLDIDPDTGLDRGERNFGVQEYDSEGNDINFFDREGYPNSNADVPVSGLRRSDGSAVPWYYAIGNHDVLNTGNFDVFGSLNFFSAEDYTSDMAKYGLIPGLANTIEFWYQNPDLAIYISSGIFGINMNLAELFALLEPIGLIPDDYYLDIDSRFDLYTLVNDTLDDPSDDGVFIAPDSDRAFMTRDGLMPVINGLGHGFNDNNGDGAVNTADGGWYSIDWQQIEPGSAVPLRILVLDSPEISSMAVGGMSELQLAWLEQQLNQAVADKVLVIVASHHRAEGASSIGTGSEELLALLGACPNVILHLAGHGHANMATPRTAEGNDPLHGYWEVETTSVATFPQQARILEVVDNRDGTGSIYMTIFDHWMTEGDESDVLARLGRELAFGDELEGGHRGDASFSGRGAERDRNVELLFQIPTEVADRLARIDNGEPITSTDSLGRRYNR